MTLRRVVIEVEIVKEFDRFTIHLNFDLPTTEPLRLAHPLQRESPEWEQLDESSQKLVEGLLAIKGVDSVDLAARTISFTCFMLNYEGTFPNIEQVFKEVYGDELESGTPHILPLAYGSYAMSLAAYSAFMSRLMNPQQLILPRDAMLIDLQRDFVCPEGYETDGTPYTVIWPYHAFTPDEQE